MRIERTKSSALVSTLSISLVALATACASGQHQTAVEPPPSSSPPPASPPPLAPLAGVYTGSQSTSVAAIDPHAHDAGVHDAGAVPPAAEVPGRIEVSEEGETIRLTIIGSAGGAPCVLAATGSRPSLTITPGQSCTDTRTDPHGTASVTLTVQEGSARFEEQALTVEFHGGMEMQQHHGAHHETRNGEVSYHFSGNHTDEAPTPPAAMEADAGTHADAHAGG